jgi:hypothetical protein
MASPAPLHGSSGVGYALGMKLRGPDRHGVLVVTTFTAVIILLAIALVLVDYFNIH